MKKKSWNYIKERIGLIIQRIFLITFCLSILIFIIYWLEIRFWWHLSKAEHNVGDIAFFTALFTGIVGFNDFSKSARLAAIFVCWLLGIIDLLIRL